jgi:flagellar basal body rod protein FlgB
MSEQVNHSQITQFEKLVQDGDFAHAQILLEKIERDRNRDTELVRAEKANKEHLLKMQTEQLAIADRMIADRIKSQILNKNTFDYCHALLATDKNKVKALGQIHVLEKALSDLNKAKLLEREKLIADILAFDPSQNEWAAQFKLRCNNLFAISTEVKPVAPPKVVPNIVEPVINNPNKSIPRKRK